MKKSQQVKKSFIMKQPKKLETEGSNSGFGGDKIQSGYANNNIQTNWITNSSDKKIILNDQRDVHMAMDKYIDKLVDNGSWILLKNKYGVHTAYIFKDKIAGGWFKVIATTNLPPEAIKEPLTYRSFRLPKSQKNFVQFDDTKSNFLDQIGVSDQSTDEIRIAKNLFNETNLPKHFKIDGKCVTIDTYKKMNEELFYGREEDPNETLSDQFFVISRITEIDIHSIKEKMMADKFVEYKHLPIELYEKSGFLPELGQFNLYERFLRKLIFDIVTRVDYQEYVKTKHFINKTKLEEEDVVDDIV